MLLCLALPFNVALTVVALLRGLVVRPPRAVAPAPKTILISGGKMTKALQLARSFHRAGHRVILVESHKYRLTGHRFSRAVDRFYTVPKPEAPGYAPALLAIVRKEGVDAYVPVCSPVASRFDAEAAAVLAGSCEVVHCDLETVDKLDDKHAFSVIAASLGLSVPASFRITQPQQVLDFDFGAYDRPFILKSIPYDPIRRLDLTELPRDTPLETAAFVQALPISPANPWVMQEFISGQEYCTHSTVRHGELQLHCCCASSAFQINYEMVDDPEIEAWVRHFVGALQLTGQVSFDFIRADDGRLYAIECNPRTHSAITMFYDQPDVAKAYLEDGVPEVKPLESCRPTYWLYHELWRLISRPTTTAQGMRTIVRGKDAIFDWADPLPFLMVHHAQIPWLLFENLRLRKGWIRIDFNIGKLVEAGGD
ncbi:MAG: ATP-grasp enzyme [Flavobacterium sp.]|nr:ATP-grasp enzyme [Aeromicrobium sp.]